jgi:hypothetical protein
MKGISTMMTAVLFETHVQIPFFITISFVPDPASALGEQTWLRHASFQNLVKMATHRTQEISTFPVI